MPDTYSARLRLVLQETGGNAGTWGGNLNDQAIGLIDDSIAGIASVDVSSTDATLTSNNGAVDQSRMAVLEFFGNVADRGVTVPTINKIYLVRNAQADFKITLKTAVGGQRTLEIFPETSVWVHVTAAGDVQQVTVPVDISAGGAGGIQIVGAFSTPAFEDLGDLPAKLISLGDTDGLVVNSGATDKPVTIKSESGTTVFQVITEDAGAQEFAGVSLGATDAITTVLGPLELNNATDIDVVRRADRAGSIILVAAGSGEAGSTFTIVGDEDPTLIGSRGNVEIAASSDVGLTPVFSLIGFSSALIDGNKIWHEGNDGKDSDLDAGKLGGFEDTDYLRLSNAGTQTAEGRLTVNQIIIAKGEGPTIRLDAQQPELQVRRLDGNGASIQQWQVGATASDTSNFTITRDGGRVVSVELDKGEDQLFRGVKGNNDPYLSLNGNYVDVNGGPKGHLKIGSVILQYGEVSISPNTFNSVTLSMPFPTACRSVTLGMKDTGNEVNSNPSYTIVNESTIRIHNYSSSSRTVSYMAMGD